MLRSLYLKNQLAFAQAANRFIYWIRKNKYLQQQISEEWYVRADIKRVLGTLDIIGHILVDLFVKLLYFTVMICLPNMIMIPVEEKPALYLVMTAWSFLIANCLLGSYLNTHISCQGNQNDYLMLHLMRFDPREHFLGRILCEYGKQLLYYTLFFVILAKGILGQPVKGFLPILMFVWCCFRPIGEAVRLKLTDTFGIPFPQGRRGCQILHGIYLVLMVLLCYGTFPLMIMTGYVYRVDSLFFHRQLMGDVFGTVSPCVPLIAFLMIVSVPAAVWALHYLWTYPDYGTVARKYCGIEALAELNITAENILTSEYKLKDKEVGEEELHARQFQEKKGYEYLNAIFFHRHKRLMRNCVKIKTMIAAVLMAGAAALLAVSRVRMPAQEFAVYSKNIWRNIEILLPSTVWFMYLTSSGEKLTRAFFFNCDIDMLKCDFYRRSADILQSFWIRLRYMLKAELSTVAVLCAGIFVNAFLLGVGGHLVHMLCLLCCAGILTVFFSIMYLCMYYIFQPYTEGGQQTSRGYQIINAVIWTGAYLCINLQIGMEYFTLLLLAVTVVVLLVSYMAVRHVAPKTFHLK